MKPFLFLLLLPCLSVAQRDIHSYTIIADTMIYQVKDQKMGYRELPLLMKSNTYKMTENALYSNSGQKFTYNDNKIEIDGIVYKFKNPWLVRGTHLVNEKTDEILVEYLHDDGPMKVLQRINDQNLRQLTTNDREALLAWALFKQMDYVFRTHNNCKCEMD